jgi:hypothetical protein
LKVLIAGIVLSMSEYQYVAFRAIDAPVTRKNLDYMRRQSTRAEITPWSFDNEYHFGDFRGNAVEMLRRGYDIHLHFADFGICKLMIRLPAGFPDPRAAAAYLIKHGVTSHQDKQGPGSVLEIQPACEPGELEGGWDFDELLSELAPLRQELMAGDLRPLYLGHLAVCMDINHDPDELVEGPVPAGLDDLTDAQTALSDLLGLDANLIEAAAMPAATLKHRRQGARDSDYLSWLESVPAGRKNQWLAALLADAEASVRVEIMAEYRAGRPPAPWPTVPGTRKLSELLEASTKLAAGKDRRSRSRAR